MIKKLLRSLARLAPGHSKGHAPANRHDPRIFKASKVGIDRRLVSQAALRTVDGLQKAGWKAYVVGGAVRDLMLGMRPKDFDVATNATPDDVQRLFRRARIIGRRFQIVHVMFGPETIEVSTFRALAPKHQETDAHGRVLRDNTFGEHHEDAARRDFTINALYYDPLSDTVLDYHDGVQDLQRKVIRMIGDPAQRYREDPVRMLRVVRFEAKLRFKVDPHTLAPVKELAELIENVPEARLFDEMVKLLQSGQALRGLQGLREQGLHHGCLPLVDLVLSPEGSKEEQALALRFVEQALAATDARVAEGKPISIGFLFACLLWNPVYRRWQAIQAGGERPIPALHAAIDDVIDRQLDDLAIPRRYVSDLREIWLMQPRFEKRGGGAAFRLFEHIRFRAGFDFLLLRAACGELEPALADWWEHFVASDADDRLTLVQQLGRAASGSTAPKRRRRRRTSSDRGDTAPAADSTQ
ncbi:MAG: tRNA nucleotidyltransferase/poly(A) polymerase protein [Pseudomonadota bacterium]